jgi:hypothetical protein
MTPSQLNARENGKHETALDAMNDRRSWWKQEAERLFKAGDMKRFAVAEKQIENWTRFEALEREALKKLEEQRPGEAG